MLSPDPTFYNGILPVLGIRDIGADPDPQIRTSDSDPTLDPTPLFSDFKAAKK